MRVLSGRFHGGADDEIDFDCVYTYIQNYIYFDCVCIYIYTYILFYFGK